MSTAGIATPAMVAYGARQRGSTSSIVAHSVPRVVLRKCQQAAGSTAAADAGAADEEGRQGRRHIVISAGPSPDMTEWDTSKHTMSYYLATERLGRIKEQEAAWEREKAERGAERQLDRKHYFPMNLPGERDNVQMQMSADAQSNYARLMRALSAPPPPQPELTPVDDALHLAATSAAETADGRPSVLRIDPAAAISRSSQMLSAVAGSASARGSDASITRTADRDLTDAQNRAPDLSAPSRKGSAASQLPSPPENQASPLSAAAEVEEAAPDPPHLRNDQEIAHMYMQELARLFNELISNDKVQVSVAEREATSDISPSAADRPKQVQKSKGAKPKGKGRHGRDGDGRDEAAGPTVLEYVLDPRSPRSAKGPINPAVSFSSPVWVAKQRILEAILAGRFDLHHVAAVASSYQSLSRELDVTRALLYRAEDLLARERSKCEVLTVREEIAVSKSRYRRAQMLRIADQVRAILQGRDPSEDQLPPVPGSPRAKLLGIDDDPEASPWSELEALLGQLREQSYAGASAGTGGGAERLLRGAAVHEQLLRDLAWRLEVRRMKAEHRRQLAAAEAMAMEGADALSSATQLCRLGDSIEVTLAQLLRGNAERLALGGSAQDAEIQQMILDAVEHSQEMEAERRRNCQEDAEQQTDPEDEAPPPPSPRSLGWVRPEELQQEAEKLLAAARKEADARLTEVRVELEQEMAVKETQSAEEIEQLQGEIDRLEEELAETRNHFMGMKQMEDSLKVREEQMQATVEAEKGKAAAAEQAAAAARKDAERANFQLSKLEDQVVEMSKGRGAEKQELEKLRPKVAGLEKDLNATQKSYVEIKEKWTDLVKSHADIIERGWTLKRQYEEDGSTGVDVLAAPESMRWCVEKLVAIENREKRDGRRWRRLQSTASGASLIAKGADARRGSVPRRRSSAFSGFGDSSPGTSPRGSMARLSIGGSEAASEDGSLASPVHRQGSASVLRQTPTGESAAMMVHEEDDEKQHRAADKRAALDVQAARVAKEKKEKLEARQRRMEAAQKERALQAERRRLEKLSAAEAVQKRREEDASRREAIAAASAERPEWKPVLGAGNEFSKPELMDEGPWKDKLAASQGRSGGKSPRRTTLGEILAAGGAAMTHVGTVIAPEDLLAAAASMERTERKALMRRAADVLGTIAQVFHALRPTGRKPRASAAPRPKAAAGADGSVPGTPATPPPQQAAAPAAGAPKARPKGGGKSPRPSAAAPPGMLPGSPTEARPSVKTAEAVPQQGVEDDEGNAAGGAAAPEAGGGGGGARSAVPVSARSAGTASPVGGALPRAPSGALSASPRAASGAPKSTSASPRSAAVSPRSAAAGQRSPSVIALGSPGLSPAASPRSGSARLSITVIQPPPGPTEPAEDPFAASVREGGKLLSTSPTSPASRSPQSLPAPVRMSRVSVDLGAQLPGAGFPGRMQSVSDVIAQGNVPSAGASRGSQRRGSKLSPRDSPAPSPSAPSPDLSKQQQLQQQQPGDRPGATPGSPASSAKGKPGSALSRGGGADFSIDGFAALAPQPGTAGAEGSPPRTRSPSPAGGSPGAAAVGKGRGRTAAEAAEHTAVLAAERTASAEDADAAAAALSRAKGQVRKVRGPPGADRHRTPEPREGMELEMVPLGYPNGEKLPGKVVGIFQKFIIIDFAGVGREQIPRDYWDTAMSQNRGHEARRGRAAASRADAFMRDALGMVTGSRQQVSPRQGLPPLKRAGDQQDQGASTKAPVVQIQAPDGSAPAAAEAGGAKAGGTLLEEGAGTPRYMSFLEMDPDELLSMVESAAKELKDLAAKVAESRFSRGMLRKQQLLQDGKVDRALQRAHRTHKSGDFDVSFQLGAVLTALRKDLDLWGKRWAEAERNERQAAGAQHTASFGRLWGAPGGAAGSAAGSTAPPAAAAAAAGGGPLLPPIPEATPPPQPAAAAAGAAAAAPAALSTPAAAAGPAPAQPPLSRGAIAKAKLRAATFVLGAFDPFSGSGAEAPSRATVASVAEVSAAATPAHAPVAPQRPPAGPNPNACPAVAKLASGAAGAPRGGGPSAQITRDCPGDMTLAAHRARDQPAQAVADAVAAVSLPPIRPASMPTASPSTLQQAVR